MSAAKEATAAQEWKRYWPLVLACAFGFSFHSVMAASTGLFMEPLGKEFGWNRAMQSSGVSIAAFAGILLSPFFGVLIDRFGTRRLALPGLVLSSLCIASFGFADGTMTQWIVMWSVYALVALAIKSTIWTAAVTGVFDKGRGLAIGVALSGTAVALTISPLLTNYLIDTFGWRQAFAWIGLGWGGVALVLCYFFLFDAHDHKAARAKAGDAPGPQLPGLTIAQAWRTPALWRIGISIFIMMTLTIALNIHQYPIMTEAGVDRTSAAYFASLAGIAGIIGKLVTGWLLDRYRVNWVGGLTLAATALAFAALLAPPSTPLIVAAMLINGYAAGTKLQITGLLTSRYGGTRNFGAIFGMMATLIAAGAGLGPVAAGALHDNFGNYDVFLIFGIVGSLFCGALIFGMSKEPKWETPPLEQAAGA
jgi:predicted MFS family arabinose efflux permease